MKNTKAKKLIRVMICMMALSLVFCLMAGAAFAADETEAAAETAQAANGAGLGLIAAALSTGIAGVGAGIAIAAGAPAAIGALTEDATTFGKSLIFVALGEGIALYGMLISILILNKI